jgi:hypothetical protein
MFSSSTGMYQEFDVLVSFEEEYTSIPPVYGAMSYYILDLLQIKDNPYAKAFN